MSKLLCAFILALLSVSHLQARDDIHTFNFPGTTAHFVIATPPGWKETALNNPVDYKFISQDGKLEGYLHLVYYKKPVAKPELSYDLFEIIEAVYEKDFFLKQDHYEIIFFEATNEYASCVFRYTNGSHKEQAVAFTFKAHEGKAKGTMSILIKGHGTRDNLEAEFAAVETILNNVAFLE